MKTYKLKSSAVRAAKKEMGENWEEFATIEVMLGDEYAIALKNPSAIAPQLPPSISSNIAAVALLAENEQELIEKAEKKAEIESTRPKHIPKLPPHALVAEKSAPAPKPDLPAFLKKAPPADLAVPVLEVMGDEGEYEIDAEALKAEQQAQADKQANIEAVNKDSAKPRLSTTEKPTKKVWHIADNMLCAAEMEAQDKGTPFVMPKRKEVIEECVRQGIAYGTSRTQYQHWFKCYNDSLATPIATIGKDGKIVPPSK